MTKTPNWPDERGSAVLSSADCRRLLEQLSGSVGRLGLVADGKPVVLPLNYELLDDDVLLRLGPGSTLDALQSEPSVAFEVDHRDDLNTDAPEAWSVLVQGNAQVIRDHLTLERAAASGLTPLVEGMGSVFVLVRDGALSGRRFPVGALARFGSLARRLGPISPVGALNLRPVLRVAATSSLADVERKLEEAGSSVTLVSDAPLTVLSYRDLARALAAGMGPETTAGSMAAAPVVTVASSAPLSRAIELMTRHDVSELLVVTDEGHAFGVLSAVEVARMITADSSSSAVHDEGELRH